MFKKVKKIAFVIMLIAVVCQVIFWFTIYEPIFFALTIGSAAIYFIAWAFEK